MNNNQFGFRPKRSTKAAATILTDDIRNCLNDGKMVGAIFVDLSKAFDTIGHDLLLRKLQQHGIFGDELAWFTDYLFNRSQVVHMNGVSSQYKAVNCGVPQGSILGPLLFIVFINDLSDHLENSKIVMYADDTVIYFSNNDISIIESSLNKDLCNLADYFDDNELIINLKKGKTESMLFGTAKRLSLNKNDFNVSYRQHLISFVDKYKYLGNILDNHLTFSNNFDMFYSKTTTRLSLLYKVRPYLTDEAAEKIYKMMIIPLLTYTGTASLSFTSTQLNKLKSIENRAKQIISSNAPLPKIYSLIKREACIFVRKCLDSSTCENFNNYFDLFKHNIRTRNNGYQLKLPKIKLVIGKKAFRFLGAKIYNELPLEIRKTSDFEEFSNLTKQHFN